MSYLYLYLHLYFCLYEAVPQNHCPLPHHDMMSSAQPSTNDRMRNGGNIRAGNSGLKCKPVCEAYPPASEYSILSASCYLRETRAMETVLCQREVRIIMREAPLPGQLTFSCHLVQHSELGRLPVVTGSSLVWEELWIMIPLANKHGQEHVSASMAFNTLSESKWNVLSFKS